MSDDNDKPAEFENRPGSCYGRRHTDKQEPSAQDRIEEKIKSHSEAMEKAMLTEMTGRNSLDDATEEEWDGIRAYAGKGAAEIIDPIPNPMDTVTNTSDGSTASYYTLPIGASELQDLISCRDMNSQIGEIFRACYRYGKVSHSDKLRDARKIKFYAEAEISRLEMYESGRMDGQNNEMDMVDNS